ncbi:hypothetical protein ABZ079_02020 [Streptomyces sp. NPDC006314]|uniref:hypothetical protein n=1 Tax=Streptomyces sp. NPDC006314 TaxID=3154475 RepID=UPI0033A1643F
MQACSCMDPVDVIARLAGYGLAGIAALVLGFVCLIAVLLAAIVVLASLVRRRHGDGHAPGAAGADEEAAGLASFRWENDPDR